MYLNLTGEQHLSRNRGSKLQKQRLYTVENVYPIRQNRHQTTINLVPRTVNQEKLVLALQDTNQHIVVTAGPAGTGKTFLSMLAAIKALKNNECKRIILTRPAVPVEGEQHGFLPGDLFAKMEPWTRPLLDVMREYYRARDIISMIEDQVLEIAPLAFMRGRNFQNSWIIADEMQNSTISQMKMLMTRIGSNSKIVITGDIEQADIDNDNTGLLDLCERLGTRPITGISSCYFEIRDIQRHPIIREILNLYND